ncbi:cupin domain-containing protein [Marinobacteraceae bacterium S3BR75-40.1]
MIDEQAVLTQWTADGFSCGEWSDPPGAVWEDNCHIVEERMLLLEGQLELIMDGHSQWLEHGQVVCVPAGKVHTVRNPGHDHNRWLYGYGPTGQE